MRRKTIRRSLSDGRSRLETKICRRKKAVEAFEKSEAFLATIFDSILDPFCIIDRDYRIVRANEAYAKMKGKGLAELLGKACPEAFCRRDVSCVDCIVRKTFETGDPCAQERIASLPDRITGWSAVHTYPIVDSEGNVTHVIEYTRDVTERKRAEEALRESEERYALAARGANDGLWDWDLRANRIYLSVRWKSMLGYGENMIGDDPQDWFGRIHP
ncbi:MAG TPA: PAS domain S-box protein, partial [Nitrospirota bacterium]